jgi:hypothetical protein
MFSEWFRGRYSKGDGQTRSGYCSVHCREGLRTTTINYKWTSVMAENWTGHILNTSLEPELYNELPILIIVDALYVSAQAQLTVSSGKLTVSYRSCKLHDRCHSACFASLDLSHFALIAQTVTSLYLTVIPVLLSHTFPLRLPELNWCPVTWAWPLVWTDTFKYVKVSSLIMSWPWAER